MAETTPKTNKVRAKLIELYTRYMPFNEKLKVYLNGDDNQYPMEIERVISNSPTAKRSARMMSKYVAGAGVTEDALINKKDNVKKSDLTKQIADDIATQYGCWIHVGYSIDEAGKLTPTNPKVLDYTKCRIGKEDDEDNKGRIFYEDYLKEKRPGRTSKKKKVKWFYPFSKKENVIITQIRKDAKEAKNTSTELKDLLPNYRGQVYYLNLTPSFVYAVSLFDSVFNDCDTEYRMSLYSNNVTRTGFLGKLAVITQGLDEEDEERIDKEVQEWLGAEEAGNVFRLNVSATDDIKNVLRIEQIKTQYDEKQYTETRKNCRMNILGAANNIPESLVFNSGGLFAQSGEAYVQLKQFYNEMTEYERSKVEETMGLLGFPCSIIPLIDESAADDGDGEDDNEVKPDEETLRAQAALRGSVGGVTGILGIQSSVVAGTTDFNSALTILSKVYGFSLEVSRALLGQPEAEAEVKTSVKLLMKKYGLTKSVARQLLGKKIEE